MYRFRRDLRHAARWLRRRPLSVAAIVVTLALGIGAGTALFSVARTVLLQPPAKPDGERLTVLAPVVAVLLLLAAVNAAGLLGARVATRQRELAVRAAVGAERGDLVRLVLLESLLLSLIAGLLGLAVARGGLRVLLHLAAGDPPWRAGIGLDWRAVLFAAALSVALALVVGLVPAFRASSPLLRTDLAASGWDLAAGHVHRQAQRRGGSSSESGQPAPTDSTLLIYVHEVSKVFCTEEVETHALSEVSLRIEAGEFVSIAGPSGSGKSTLLSILGLLDPPTAGEYALGGRQVAGLGPRDRASLRNREIGFVFQSFNLIGELSVSHNVALPLLYRRLPADDVRRRVEYALERVGMAHRMKHYPWQLSGGQQQRVAVARAVVGEPAILLADEPVGDLDSANGESVMHLLEELHESGSTICMVTHDERCARHAARTVQLFDGRIVNEL